MEEYNYKDHPTTEGVVEPSPTPAVTATATTIKKYIVDNGEKRWVELWRQGLNPWDLWRATSDDSNLISDADFVDNFQGKWNEKGLHGPTRFKMYFRDMRVGEFTLAPLYSCCGVVVSSYTCIFEQHRGKRYAKIMQTAKEAIARLLGYSMMLATVEVSNIPEIVSASNAGWRVKEIFINKRTNHQLAILTKELK